MLAMETAQSVPEQLPISVHPVQMEDFWKEPVVQQHAWPPMFLRTPQQTLAMRVMLSVQPAAELLIATA